MMTLRKLKLKEFEKNEITLDELKEALLRWYYPQVYKQRPDLFERDMEREMIVTEVKGTYGNTSSVVFSVNGSPPKGEAVLFVSYLDKNYWEGEMVAIGNRRVSNRINKVKIKKDS